MPAGPEMDALVAEKVMGCQRRYEQRTDPFGTAFSVTLCGCEQEKRAKVRTGSRFGDALVNAHAEAFAPKLHATDYYGEFRHYSTDIAAAWEVVGRLVALGYCYYVEQCARPDEETHAVSVMVMRDGHHINDHYEADRRDWYASHESAPVAICRAALLVVNQ